MQCHFKNSYICLPYLGKRCYGLRISRLVFHSGLFKLPGTITQKFVIGEVWDREPSSAPIITLQPNFQQKKKLRFSSVTLRAFCDAMALLRGESGRAEPVASVETAAAHRPPPPSLGHRVAPPAHRPALSLIWRGGGHPMPYHISTYRWRTASSLLRRPACCGYWPALGNYTHCYRETRQLQNLVLPRVNTSHGKWRFM